MDVVTKEQLVFDVIKVLTVIENDSDVNSVFRNGGFTQSYELLCTLAKQNSLPDEILTRINGIYTHIIMQNQAPLKAYARLFLNDENPIEVAAAKEIIAEEVIEETTQKKYTLPKHYGKVKIMADIEANNGVMTELDRAMLGLNDLRNVYGKLKRRCVKEKKLDVKKLTDADYRDIVAVIKTVEKKMADILKK